MFVSEGDIVLKKEDSLDNYAIEGVIRWWDDMSGLQDVYNFPYKDVERQEIEIIDEQLYTTGNMVESYRMKVIRKMFWIGRFSGKAILLLNFDDVNKVNSEFRKVLDHDTSMYGDWLGKYMEKYVYKIKSEIDTSFHCVKFSGNDATIGSKESMKSRSELSEYIVMEKIDLVIGCGGYIKKGFVSQDSIYFDVLVEQVRRKMADANRLGKIKFLNFTI